MFWLDVAMNNTGSVRGNECRGNLRRNIQYFDQLEPLTHVLSQCDAIDELSSNKSSFIGTANFIDRKNVWVIKRRGGLRFLDETLQPGLMSSDFA